MTENIDSQNADVVSFGRSLPKPEVVHLVRCSIAVESRSIDAARRSSPLGRSSVGELLNHVDRRLGSKLTLKAVSQHVGLSRAVFTRTFRCSVGLSFHRYLMLRRIEVAKQLLLDTDFDITFVSDETGFSSQGHFGSVFRDIAGNTPARFREQSRKGHFRKTSPSLGTISVAPLSPCGLH